MKLPGDEPTPCATAWRRADAPCERRPVNQNCLSSDALVTCPALAGWPDGSEFESQRHLNQPPVRANQGVADPAKAPSSTPQFRIGEDRGVGQIVEVGPILQLVALGEVEPLVDRQVDPLEARSAANVARGAAENADAGRDK